LDFEHSLGRSDDEKAEESNLVDEVDYMVESRLRSLFESARESGKDQMQVRLDCKPIAAGAQMVNLYV
jgi:phosphate uptake regulator